MPLTDEMQLVSVDDHLIEPPDLWQNRLPVKYKDRGPRIIESTKDAQDEFGAGITIPKGSQVWLLDGEVHAQLGLNAVAGKPFEERGTDPVRFDEMLPGCYDPRERVKDMDLDGVQVATCFPSFPKFAGTLFLTMNDKSLALMCIQAWNDFMVDEWCAAAPDRFIPLMILPLWDVQLCVQEVQRMAARGVRAVSFPENPVPLGLPSFHSDHWAPLLSAIEDADLVLCLHFGTSGQVPRTAPDAPMAVMVTLMGCGSMYATADLLFSPVFHRHPRLRVALSEGGVGWMPYIVERADFVWERHRSYMNINPDIPPSELFRKHIWGCFISDEYGVDNRHDIGIDRLTWECDYPHSDSNWPNSRKMTAEVFVDVPDAEVQQIVEWNARELFRFARS